MLTVGLYQLFKPHFLFQTQRIALQGREDIRLPFMAEICIFDAHQLVFLGETGIVCTKQYLTLTGLHKLLDFLFLWLYVLRINELLGKNRLSARGIPPVVRDYSHARWAPSYSTISAIPCDGLLAICEPLIKESRSNT